jgi:hypothetical protein
MTDVFDRVRAANPVPDATRYVEFVVGNQDQLLGLVRDRRDRMSLDEITKLEQPQPRRTPPNFGGWKAAIVAVAAVVAIVAAAVVALSSGTATEPPASPAPSPTTTAAPPPQEESAPTPSTTAPTTTVATVAPEPTEEDLVFAESLATAYNAEDMERYMALLPPNVAFTDPDPGSGGLFTVTDAQLRRDNVLWWELDQRLTLDACRALTSGSISCRYTVTDAFSEAVGFPSPVATLNFRQEDGRAVEYSEAWQMGTHVDATRLLRGWFDENKPGEPRPFDDGFADYGRWGHLYPEDPALMLLYLDEYAASFNN